MVSVGWGVGVWGLASEEVSVLTVLSVFSRVVAEPGSVWDVAVGSSPVSGCVCSVT